MSETDHAILSRLSRATKAGYWAAYHRLVDEVGPHWTPESYNWDCASLLHHACRQRSVAQMGVLVNRGIDVNHPALAALPSAFFDILGESDDRWYPPARLGQPGDDEVALRVEQARTIDTMALTLVALGAKIDVEDFPKVLRRSLELALPGFTGHLLEHHTPEEVQAAGGASALSLFLRAQVSYELRSTAITPAAVMGFLGSLLPGFGGTPQATRPDHVFETLQVILQAPMIHPEEVGEGLFDAISHPLKQEITPGGLFGGFMGPNMQRSFLIERGDAVPDLSPEELLEDTPVMEALRATLLAARLGQQLPAGVQPRPPRL